MFTDVDVVVNCGIAKKVGRPNYSSYEASMNMQVVTNLNNVTDEKFPELVGHIYTQIQKAIDARIAWECREDKGPSMVAPVSPAALHVDVTRHGVATPIVPNVSTPPAPAAPVATPAAPATAPYQFRDFLGSTARELAISPESIVNYFYRIFIKGSVADSQWQEQGKALAAYWTTIPNAAVVFAQSLNNMPSF